jgi:DNA repair and recombination protein RAD52
MFNDKQNQVLAYELDSSRIKTRDKGNMSLSYLEGFDIIETANKIFGFGNWTYAISTLELASQESNQNQNSVICYKAIVNIVVHDLQHSKHISREDVGFGTGIAKSLADAHESAGKEAVTDALKRAFRSFGNQFGNSLYDKSRAHQNQQPTQPQQQTQQPSIPQRSNNIPQDYASLYNLGLSVVRQGNSLVVIGEDIFAKKDSIKAYGFKWDTKNRVWHKPLEQQAA